MIRPNDGAPVAPSSETPLRPAEPIIEKQRWPFPWIWIVPLIALAVGGWYLYQYEREQGPMLSIHFNDASGLKVGQSTLQLHGVDVGMVKHIVLSEDKKSAVVQVRLQRPQSDLARKNTKFWIVKPQITDMSISGLNTVISGPYVTAQPGDGEATTEFAGLEGEPVVSGPGLRVILHADRLEHLQVSSPVYYRGFQVGVVQDIRLSDEADQANVTLFIWPHYTPLVRRDSKFWSVSGADIRGGVFSGVKVQLDSLRALISGGIAFATPTNTQFEPIKDGAQFDLYNEAGKGWQDWQPRIKLPTDDNSAAVNKANADQKVSLPAGDRNP